MSPREHGQELARLRGHAGGLENLLKNQKTSGGIERLHGEGPRCHSPAPSAGREELQMAFGFSAIKNLI